MSKKKKKFYVVWEGRKSGIYDNWEDCKAQIFQYEGAKYKSFIDLQSAQKAFKGNYFDFLKKDARKLAFDINKNPKVGKPIKNSICVDAACSGNPGILEYRGVDYRNNQEIFRMGPYEQGTVNIGEFLAIVHALALLKRHKINLPIYSDSRTAMAWVRKKKANTKLQKTKKNEFLFELVSRAERWLNDNTVDSKIIKWETKYWGEIPADFGRK